MHRYQAILRNATANQFCGKITPTNHCAKYRFTNLANATDTSHILLNCAGNIPSLVISSD
ncbi:MAG: hypothetical protein N2035_08950 [Chthoniobacterales bacterium]|nr:hypothetical protein [Chthoniobacterales bacterium]